MTARPRSTAPARCRSAGGTTPASGSIPPPVNIAETTLVHGRIRRVPGEVAAREQRGEPLPPRSSTATAARPEACGPRRRNRGSRRRGASAHGDERERASGRLRGPRRRATSARGDHTDRRNGHRPSARTRTGLREGLGGGRTDAGGARWRGGARPRCPGRRSGHRGGVRRDREPAAACRDAAAYALAARAAGRGGTGDGPRRRAGAPASGQAPRSAAAAAARPWPGSGPPARAGTVRRLAVVAGRADDRAPRCGRGAPLRASAAPSASPAASVADTTPMANTPDTRRTGHRSASACSSDGAPARNSSAS